MIGDRGECGPFPRGNERRAGKATRSKKWSDPLSCVRGEDASPIRRQDKSAGTRLGRRGALVLKGNS